VTYWVGPFVAIIAIHWRRSTVAAHVEAVQTPVGDCRPADARRSRCSSASSYAHRSPIRPRAPAGRTRRILKTVFGSVSGDLHGAGLAYPVGILAAGLL
jgi:hypothetical protein